MYAFNDHLAEFFGSSSHLGIAGLIVPTGSFFLLKIHVSVEITEELSPNVRRIHFSVIENNEIPGKKVDVVDMGFDGFLCEA